MFELFYLAFEVTDVLGRVCVIQLTLDFSFFLLLAEHNNVNQCRWWKQDFFNTEVLRILFKSWSNSINRTRFAATAATLHKVKAGCRPFWGRRAKVSGESLSFVLNFLLGPQGWDFNSHTVMFIFFIEAICRSQTKFPFEAAKSRVRPVKCARRSTNHRLQLRNTKTIKEDARTAGVGCKRCKAVRAALR